MTRSGSSRSKSADSVSAMPEPIQSSDGSAEIFANGTITTVSGSPAITPVNTS